MSQRRQPGPFGLPRRLYARARLARRTRADSDLQPRLALDRDAPELLLSPHWDDAALDCWALLTDARALTVVNLFAGIPAPGERTVWESILGVRDSAERAHARMAEDERALAHAGRAPINLALPDRRHRAAGAAPTLAQLDRAVAAAVASASRVHVPAGIGAHPDHLLARRYGRALLHAGIPVTLYAELPYCIFHGWPSWVDGGEPQPDRDVDAYWTSFLAGVPEMPALRAATVVRLDEATAARKREAIDCYRASLNHGARRLLALPEMHAFEVSWRLRGPG
jgi:GlcNAc-PI de-N-acetylase